MITNITNSIPTLIHEFQPSSPVNISSTTHSIQQFTTPLPINHVASSRRKVHVGHPWSIRRSYRPRRQSSSPRRKDHQVRPPIHSQTSSHHQLTTSHITQRTNFRINLLERTLFRSQRRHPPRPRHQTHLHWRPIRQPTSHALPLSDLQAPSTAPPQRNHSLLPLTNRIQIPPRTRSLLRPPYVQPGRGVSHVGTVSGGLSEIEG